MNTESLSSKIFAIATKRPSRGFTTEDVFYRLHKQGVIAAYKTVEGRISEMKSRGALVATGRTRKLKDTGRFANVLVVNQSAF